jgi:hypothetical protein
MKLSPGLGLLCSISNSSSSFPLGPSFVSAPFYLPLSWLHTNTFFFYGSSVQPISSGEN